MKVDMRKLQIEISGLKNLLGKIKTSLESLTSRGIDAEDRIGGIN